MTLLMPQPLESPHPHRFTREDYYQMADFGMFQDKRVELIDGEIIDMPAMRDVHAASTLLALHALQRTLPHLLIRTQLPLSLGDRSDPEPDVSVVEGTIRDYIGTGHPQTAVLVVEVADTSLRFDRVKKASLYARSGILDYWIINLIEHCVEVMRNPVKDSGAHLGYRYESVEKIRVPNTVSPLVKPDVQIAVADLLP